jgi:methionyl-tRNA formyltransferase
MRIVFLGSGAFGLPTLKHLAAQHDVELVVTQPDRPSGRGRTLTPTPVGAWADEAGLPCLRVQDVNAPDSLEHIRSIEADAWVIIAFGQKLGESLLADTFAMNLHASLLPRHRGAAPIHHAILAGDERTGLSVITIADRIDAGDVLGQCETDIRPDETTGTLHDRLATMGPELIEQVLQAQCDGSLRPVPQDDTQSTIAPKLSKDRATVHFDQDAECVRNGVHGLVPWPGCTIRIGTHRLRLLKLEVVDRDVSTRPPGSLSVDGIVACNPGHVRLLDVQSPGKRPMPFSQWLHGHQLDETTTCLPLDDRS